MTVFDTPGRRSWLGSGVSRARRAYGFALVGVGVPLLTAALLPLRGTLGLDHLLLTYLLVLVAASAIGGWGPAFLATVVTSICANYFFTPPYSSLAVAEPGDLLDLGIFLAVAVLVAFGAEAGAASRAHAERSRLVADWIAQLSLREPASVEAALSEAHTVLDASAVSLLDAGRVVAQVGHARPGDEVHDEDAGGGLVLRVARPPVLGADPRTLALLASTVGRLHRTEELSRQARRAEDLARVDEVRSALLAAVGHDLRNPLAAIKASVATLRDPALQGHLDADDRAALLAGIEGDTDRLTGLVGDLLDMSRIRAGALSVHLQPTSVAAALSALSGSDADLRLRLPEGLPPAAADPGLLDRVVGNLVENARRHAPGSPVDVEADAARGRVLIRVADHGPGIPPEDVEGAFVPFQRLDDHAHGGVGLGLAIARGFTEAMGGHLVPSRTPGGGLTMTIDLEEHRDAPADR